MLQTARYTVGAAAASCAPPPILRAPASRRWCWSPATAAVAARALERVSICAVPNSYAPAATPKPSLRPSPAFGSDAVVAPGSVPSARPARPAGNAAARSTPFPAQCRRSGRTPSWFAHPAHTQTQTAARSSITLLAFQGMRSVVSRAATSRSVRNVPGLFCQGCSRSVPPPLPEMS